MRTTAILLSALAATVVGLGCGEALTPSSDAEEPKVKPVAAVLQIAVSADSARTEFAFRLENRSDKALETTPLATNYNRIVVVDPKGAEFEHFSWKKGIPPVIVAAGETQVWRFALADILEGAKATAPGVYSIGWKVGELSAPRIAVQKD